MNKKLNIIKNNIPFPLKNGKIIVIDGKETKFFRLNNQI